MADDTPPVRPSTLRTPAPSGATDSLARPMNTTEAARSHIAEHGRGTSRWLAQQYGVSQRTAQRWLAGTQQPRNPAPLMAGANNQQVRINAMRVVRFAKLGTVDVWEPSPRTQSRRDLGLLEVDMSPVADLLEAGGTEAQANEMAREIYTEAYFGSAYGGDYPIEITGYGANPEFY